MNDIRSVGLAVHILNQIIESNICYVDHVVFLFSYFMKHLCSSSPHALRPWSS